MDFITFFVFSFARFIDYVFRLDLFIISLRILLTCGFLFPRNFVSFYWCISILSVFKFVIKITEVTSVLNPCFKFYGKDSSEKSLKHFFVRTWLHLGIGRLKHCINQKVMVPNSCLKYVCKLMKTRSTCKN